MPSRPSGDFQAAASRWALVFIGRCGGTWSQEVKCGKWVFWPWATAAIHSHGATTSLTCLLRLSSDSQGTLKLGTGGVHSSQLQTTSHSFGYQAKRPLTGVVCKPHRRQTGLVAFWIRRLLGSLVEGDEGSGRGFLQEGSQLCGGPYGPLGKNVSTHPKPAHSTSLGLLYLSITRHFPEFSSHWGFRHHRAGVEVEMKSGQYVLTQCQPADEIIIMFFQTQSQGLALCECVCGRWIKKICQS